MNETILIIEDDPALLNNLIILLQEENYNVISTNNGAEGLTAAKNNTPDLIICDVMMPKLSGHEVLESLTKDPNIAPIPFIFLTAKTEKEDIRIGLGLGADDYLLKPFDIPDLLKAIRTRLTKYSNIKKSELSKIEEQAKQKKKYSAEDRIFLTLNKKSQFVKIHSIVFIEAERQYVNLLFEDGNRLIMRKSLTYWENLLPSNLFVRISRSVIINLDFVLKVKKWFNHAYKVNLTDNFGEFIMSKRYAKRIKGLVE